MKHFYPLRFVLCSLVLTLSVGLSAQYANIACTGYNNDIIANDGSASSNTATTGTVEGVTYPTTWVDGNIPLTYGFIASDYKWWSGGPAATCGLVSNGSYPSGATPGLTYIIQSTTADNSMSIASDVYSGSVLPTSGTLTLVTPGSYTKLFVLYETVINTAGPNITATVTFTDLSTQIIAGNTVVNWFTAGISGYAGVMQRAANTAPGNPTTCQTTGPRLFEMPLTIDPSNYGKLVKSVTFEWSAPIGTAINTVNYFHGMALAGLAPCTSPPVVGTVTSNANPLCAGAPFTLSITGGTTGTGQTFQWQSSPDTLAWTTNPADTFSVLQTSQSGSTWYRVIVTCSGLSDTSYAYQEVSPALIPGGTFTINSSLPTAGTNFISFADAVNYIKCGISGPIVFNVAPGSGPYMEQVNIPAIYGTSATNTIRFKGNGAALQFASADGNNRHVVKLDGADYVTLDSFVIDATGGTYGWAIHFINGADNDSIKNCVIYCDVTALTSNYAGIVMNGSVSSPTTGGNSASNAVIIGNNITGGYYGIINYGLAAIPFPTGNRYINNVLNDFYYYGIYTYGAINPVISGNTIERLTRTNQATTYGIFMGAYTSGAIVDKNRIIHLFDANTTSTSTAYGISLSGDADAGSQNLITNNLIADINHNGIIYGIYNTGAANMKAYHNTISLDNVSATGGTTYGFYQTVSDTGMVFENNLITISRGGTGSKYGIYMSTATTPLVSNYNDVYLSSTGTGTQAFGYNVSARVTLADWQTATGFDLNSVSTDPLYTSIGNDYTPTATPLNDRGTPVGVTTDILGMPRNLSHPDIGAYEFSGSVCVSPPTAGDALAPIDTVCAGSSASLQLINNSVGAGQTYQWSSSPSSSGPWTPLGGPLTVSDTIIIATTTLWYRATVTCGTSSATSTPAYISVTQPLAGGTYTINAGQNTGGTNFTSFADAASALKCGITGPVVMNVVPGSGPYTEQFSLNALSGTSPVNRLIINGNGETIKFASANGSARHVIQLSGANYVTIKNLTVDATGGTYGFGIVLTNQANNDSIVNCTVMADMTATSTNFAGIAITGAPTAADAPGNSANNTVVMNCTVNGGYFGITNNGSSGSPYITNNRFIHNTVNDFYSYGIYNYGSVNAVISGNTVQRLTRTNSGTTVYGIYINSYCTGALVEKNRVMHLFDAFTSSTNAAYCLYMTADATAASPNIVVNNLVSDINHNGAIYGIYNTGGRYTKNYHNTISLDNTSATTGTTYGIYQSTIDTGIVYLNNMITITRGGSGIKYGFNKAATTTLPLVSDYNDIYVNSAGGTQAFGYSGAVLATLADWQLATTLDSNSRSIDPLYVSPGTGDFHPSEATLDNLATPLGILTDIENVTRSTSTPDMGAFEFGQIQPVRLVDFSAVKVRTDALLSWTTGSEINFSRFEVQRSANGEAFTNAGTVSAGAPSPGLKSYRFTDAGVLAQPATLYYRLKMFNRDGSYQYSKIVLVKAQGGETVTVYPNPVINKLFVKVSVDRTQSVTINLSDLSGRILRSSTQTITAGTAVRSVAGAEKLEGGMYILTAVIGQDRFTYKVVK